MNIRHTELVRPELPDIETELTPSPHMRQSDPIISMESAISIPALVTCGKILFCTALLLMLLATVWAVMR